MSPILAATSDTTSLVALMLAVFAASAVEMVEALTIVVAVGATRGWRTALQGAGAALGALAVCVVVGGIPLVRYAPINGLRVGVGALLLLLGLAWLRKAILRAAGVLPEHDEDAIYAATVASLSGGRDVEGFGVAFKGVLLEGLEVVLIVISLGASQHRLGQAAAAGAAALIVVGALGAVVARQLSEVPENLLKLVVGIMLTSFGTFWIGEGAGARWPGADAMLPALVALFALVALTTVRWLRRTASPRLDVGTD
ncbi:MAG: COG4280 domain-containing protein [Acidimicrobiales bacterium]